MASHKVFYSAGLLLSDSGPDPSVVLIHKLRPENQKGLLNGVGGHVEPGETALQAMIREFREETGMLVENWEHIVQLVHDEWEVAWFRAYGDTSKARTQTDEEVLECRWPLAPEVRRMETLDWLIPLCNNRSGVLFPITVMVK